MIHYFWPHAVAINKSNIGYYRLTHFYLLSAGGGNQQACPVTLHFQWSIYFWIVPSSKTSGRSNSPHLLRKTFYK